jgi:phosphoglycerate dehydrogenase-like enzyme
MSQETLNRPAAAAKSIILVLCPSDLPVLRLLEPLRAVAEVIISNDQATLMKAAPRAQVILVSGIDAAQLNLPDLWKRAAALRWIHSLMTGVEKLLFPALIESPIPLTNARGVFKRSLAEFAILGILFHTKKVRRLIDNQRSRRWDDFTVGWADQRVMGVVGFGAIGRECALLAQGMGLKIHAFQRRPPKAPDPLVERVFGPGELHGMLEGIDVLLCAAPLTPDTHHLISDAEFDVMQPTALIINVGRGPVIDESALVRALQAQKIAGASLDVFEHEPLPETSPLWGMDNVLISPHCTDRTIDPDFMDLSMQVFIDNFHRYRQGQPLENIVDKQAGY